MNYKFYKNRVRITGGEFALTFDTNNKLDDVVIDYIMYFIKNFLSKSMYFVMHNMRIPTFNKIYDITIRYSNTLELFTIDTKEYARTKASERTF